MPLKTNSQPEPERDPRLASDEPSKSYVSAGPPSREELDKLIDNVPDGGVPGRIDEGEYVPDEPGEPGWPAAPIKDAK